MIIGVPKEIKNNENRVALTPAGAQEFVRRGHTVYLQTKAGEGSGFSDEEYIGAGAKILATAEAVFSAAKMAAGMGADVIIADVNINRLRYLDDVMPKNVHTIVSNDYVLRELVKTHDLIIGGVLVPGAKAPKLITRDMLKTMRPGTVLVDVAVDQGGCIETCKPTTHEDPTFIIDDVVHYCVANMPGAVPYTSTLALTNATLPYALKLAGHGWKKACTENQDLKKGLNVINGKVVYKAVADAFNLPYTDVKEFLN